MKVVICGGGIIGASTAYHLAKRGIAATVIDRCGVACAASGKAGGFLARDWCNSGPVGALARTSFDMHMELAKTFTDCDYRRVDTLSVDVNPTGKKKNCDILPPWVDGVIVDASSLGSCSTTAQVHPHKLSNVFINAASELVATTVRIGTVEEVIVEDGKVCSIRVGTELIPADVVVIAMGPWSGQARKWFQHLPPFTGDPHHSIVLRPMQPVTAHALFTDFHGRGEIESPEVYPRPDGTVYLCGSAEKPKLPDNPQEIQTTECAETMLRRAAMFVSSSLKDAELVRADCCFLPCSPDGLPVIGRIPDVKGAYIATGHTCWGILNAPATGACLAELIADGKCTIVDISPFDPARFR